MQKALLATSLMIIVALTACSATTPTPIVAPPPTTRPEATTPPSSEPAQAADPAKAPTPRPAEIPTKAPAPAPIPGPTPTMAPAPTVPPDATAGAPPLPSTERTVRAPAKRCGALCNEEFWEGGATVASVQAELDAGADPAAKGDDRTPALVYAVAFGSNPEIVRLLLEGGADPNVKDDESGRPPLHSAVELAAYASHPDAGSWSPGNADDLALNVTATIKLLLQGGADAAARDKYGQSALFWYLGTILN